MSEVSAICTTMASLKKERAELVEKTSDLPSLRLKEKELIEKQRDFQKQNDVISVNQESINKVQHELSIISVNSQNLSTIKQYFERRVTELSLFLNGEQLPLLKGENSNEMNRIIRQGIADDDGYIQSVITNDQQVLQSINLEAERLCANRSLLEERARKNRAEVENFTEGAGIVLGELGRVRESIAQFVNLEQIGAEKSSQLNEQYALCQKALVSLAELRQKIFLSRNSVVTQLNQSLSPSIRTELTHQTDLQSYMENLESSFRGSSLKYKGLVPEMVQKVNPQWLLYYTSHLKYDDFSAALGIPIDRATRVLGYLSDIDLGSVLTSEIEA
ncbi:hypothetical protein Psal006b_03294 (plasmid) [Piscirickettsia salmonis]|nr:hypothetical protein [Piscirickettsia salmonis]AKP74914.2 hypothetical protein PSLF89_1p105 [Piscirickettsia salmonis LF-89 = ATCC VR-1361]ALY04538.1 hypothetical protein AWE47_16660 [Piscirickettsia salmonis]AMA43905.1 hypothetical protein AWJ11_16070 [Piscirickettsia salmonis]AOS37123.1 hypothetical protein AVM72_17400 [Piscirickettsia salmonis]APS62078.1 hypothetical protein AVI53_16045 [Piscirickettsia salmonis]